MMCNYDYNLTSKYTFESMVCHRVTNINYCQLIKLHQVQSTLPENTQEQPLVNEDEDQDNTSKIESRNAVALHSLTHWYSSLQSGEFDWSKTPI